MRPVTVPLIRRDALIAAGVVSDPAFDGTLALATLWETPRHLLTSRDLRCTSLRFLAHPPTV